MEIKYKDIVTLQSFFYKSYMSTGSPGYSDTLENDTLWEIVNPQNPENTGNLSYKDVIALRSTCDGQYFTLSSQPTSPDQIIKYSSWEIVNPDNTSIEGPLYDGSVIGLKSMLDNYRNYYISRGLALGENSDENVSPDGMWRIEVSKNVLKYNDIITLQLAEENGDPTGEKWQLVNAHTPGKRGVVQYGEVIGLRSLANSNEYFTGDRVRQVNEGRISADVGWKIVNPYNEFMQGVVNINDVISLRTIGMYYSYYYYVSGMPYHVGPNVDRSEPIPENGQWKIINVNDQVIKYSDIITLQLPYYNGKFLSGGAAVKTIQNEHITADERWQIVNADTLDSTDILRYQDNIALRLPGHNNQYLSLKTEIHNQYIPQLITKAVTQISGDEIWTITDAHNADKKGAVLYKDIVSLRLPFHKKLYLSINGSVAEQNQRINEYWRITNKFGNQCEPDMWFLTSTELTERNWGKYYCNEPFTRNNKVEALVDGQSYMGKLFELLTSVGLNDYINIIGWSFNKDTKLLGAKNLNPSNFIDLLQCAISKKAKVRALVNKFQAEVSDQKWHPLIGQLAFTGMNRTFAKYLKNMGGEAFLDGRYVCNTDYWGSHHQKSIMLSLNGGKDHHAFVGGIDIADDRFDISAHPVPGENPERPAPVVYQGWHDIQCHVQGNAARQIWANFVDRWNDRNESPLKSHDVIDTQDSADIKPLLKPSPEVTLGEQPGKINPGSQSVQVLRTFACKPKNSDIPWYPFAPEGEHTVSAGLIKAILQAKHYIYIEDQYFWASEILDALAKTSPSVKVILLLARDCDLPGQNDWQKHVRTDAFAAINNGHTKNRVFPYHMEHKNQDSVIYVHSKLMIIDDRYVSIGSANMAYRSTDTDSELTLAIVDSGRTTDGKMNHNQQERCVFAKNLRIKLWAEHLGVSETHPDLDDPIVALDKLWPSHQSNSHVPNRRNHVVCLKTGLASSQSFHRKSEYLQPTDYLNPAFCRPPKVK